MQLLAGVLVELGVGDKEGQLAGDSLDKADLLVGEIARPIALDGDHALELIGAEMEALGAEQDDRHRQDRAERLLAQAQLDMEAAVFTNIADGDRAALARGPAVDALAQRQPDLPDRRRVEAARRA